VAAWGDILVNEIYNRYSQRIGSDVRVTRMKVRDTRDRNSAFKKEGSITHSEDIEVAVARPYEAYVYVNCICELYM